MSSTWDDKSGDTLISYFSQTSLYKGAPKAKKLLVTTVTIYREVPQYLVIDVFYYSRYNNSIMLICLPYKKGKYKKLRKEIFKLATLYSYNVILSIVHHYTYTNLL